jgi:hypothetical protein
MTDSETSKDDNDRKIMIWTTKIETYLLEIREKANVLIKEHSRNYNKYKNLFYCINIPEAIILFILSSLTMEYKNTNELLTNILTITAGILSLINSFIDPGKLYTQHIHYVHLYEELTQEIDIELVKSKALRMDADLFLQKINSNYTNLNNKAPN